MDTEFNKTLSEVYLISSKAEHSEKNLLNAEIWGSKSILLLNYFNCKELYK
jgi:hypothetical protein